MLKDILGQRDEALVMLAKSHIIECKSGFALIRKGHVSLTLYILLSGSLEQQGHAP